jgi:DNA-binding winged helix-turn-helix (wHTH) protein/tetratricopeptide (TPR) repeat protein
LYEYSMSDAVILSFGTFELHSDSSELRHNGDLVKLPPQPFKVLEILARKGGQVVTRADIREQVWCGDTFVDFEQGLNFCIRQIREALGDTADAPRFIETLPKRGYRLLMPVTSQAPAQPMRLTRLIVLPFRMLRPDPETEFLAFSLSDALTASLSTLKKLVVRSSMAAAKFGANAEMKTVAAEADVDVIVTGTLLRAGNEVRVTTQMTDTATGTMLASHSAQTPLGNLFRMEDELTERIVASLALPLTAGEHYALHRDVPASTVAYEFYLRGNQLSYDPKQWSIARDLYLRSVEEDPAYAPAWARLGRIHHVMSKYLPAGTPDGLEKAETALQRALELNPELSLAHKLLAQLDADRGRARDAMTRLIEQAQTLDPDLMVGLVTACRYCGLLDASEAAHKRAVELDPKIKTSIPHTWFVRADYARLVTLRVEDLPYLVALALKELGREEECPPALLRELENKNKTRIRDFIVAGRALLEGDREESIAAVNRILASNFQDPEGLFYLSRHLAYLGEVGPALELFRRVVKGGYFCYPAMVKDPWLDPMRKEPEFAKLLHESEIGHREAAAAFKQLSGEKVLRIAV